VSDFEAAKVDLETIYFSVFVNRGPEITLLPKKSSRKFRQAISSFYLNFEKTLLIYFFFGTLIFQYEVNVSF
jgi:hypothetical protein